jgi:histidinol-phosphate aminotransferase
MHFRSVIDIIQPYDTGISLQSVKEKYNLSEGRIVNLCFNENPYPPPERVIDAIMEEARKANRYPDSSYQLLKEKISQYTNLPVENIAVGSGAADILDVICKIVLDPFDKVVIPVPNYTMYIFLGMLRDASLKFIQTEEPNFDITADEIISAAQEAKLVFLSSPNNPTGRTIGKRDLIKIIEETDALIVVDEAYYEYCGKTVADSVRKYDNLIVVRTFSKFFGLAGLRIGYALCDEKVAAMLEKARLPFNVSRIAQKAAIASLDEIPWFNKIRDEILRERESVLQQIKEIASLEPLPSEANFLLVKLSGVDMKNFIEKLSREGVIIRDVSGLHGLRNNYVRITIGRKDENRKLISAIRDFFFR